MNKNEYLEDLAGGVDTTLQDRRFNNYKKQLAARKLSADFQRSYTEEYLWNRAIYLSSNGCILLDNVENKRLAIKSLKEAAEIFENLSSIGENYDQNYCLILAALCYDFAGYQANALCLTRNIDQYILEGTNDIEIAGDNYIISQIHKILLKKIFYGRANIDRTEIEANLGIHLFNKAITNWYESILNGSNNSYEEDINQAYLYFLNAQNVHISHLLFLLRSRIRIYSERSIWKVLFQIEHITDNTTWGRYIKLLTHDIYDRNSIKEAKKRTSKFEFWTSQLRAIENGVLSSDSNFVLQMPTSAGKTFIAELTILNALIKYPGRKCIYVAPFRALTNEKETELADYISKLGYSVSALSGSYELDEFQEIILDETDVLVATPEKVDLLLRVNPVYFNSISLIVIDEGHIVGDISSRSSLLEFLIIRLKILIADLRILFISAVMPPANADEYSIWLSGAKDNVLRSSLHPDSPLDEEWEPTRKLIGSFGWSGQNGRITYKNVNTENEENNETINAFIPAIIRKKQFGDVFPNGTNKAQTCVALAYELSIDGNCLIFCSQVRNTKSVGDAFLDLLEILEEGHVPDFYNINQETESYFFSMKWFGNDSYITRCIERGIGVHFGDMPESVRRAVEADYSSGKLRVLIATNTVGQGLNFPIKHIVVNSTIIRAGAGEVQKVSVRDFWNLIGRAGRAGKETEGQVVFVINSPTDNASYNLYTNRENIEGAYSMFFNVLRTMLIGRINEETFEKYISTLSEPYLLSILSEEILDGDDAEIIEQIINNSLFKVQIELNELDITPLRTSFNSITQKIREVVDTDTLNVFGLTGFSLESNQAIDTYIQNHLEELIEIINNDDYEAFLKSVFTLFDEESIEEVSSEKFERIVGTHLQYSEIALQWINGSEINELQNAWHNISPNPTHLNILISEGFYFRYPWGITAFITILLYRSGLDNDNLQPGIGNLSSYIKFGVNNPTAALARSLGIKNRDIAMILATKSNDLEGKEFIKWLANVTKEDTESYGINRFDEINILNTAVKLTPNRFEETPEVFEFLIRGTSFEVDRINNSLTVNEGDTIIYAREPNNAYDPFAIKLFKEQLGIRLHSKRIFKNYFSGVRY